MSTRTREEMAKACDDAAWRSDAVGCFSDHGATLRAAASTLRAPPAAAIHAEIAPDDVPQHWCDTTYAACAYAAGYNAALRKIKEGK